MNNFGVGKPPNIKRNVENDIPYNISIKIIAPVVNLMYSPTVVSATATYTEAAPKKINAL